MLLLVLILVLIAFGLLVVALLSGSVLWAWVSVVVSVGAAAVLLVDWLQRRAAVKAGAETGSAADAPPPPAAHLDPATEVIPVIPAAGPVPGAPARGPSGNGLAGAPAGPSAAAAPAPSAAPAPEPPFDPAVDSQQTVVMPVIQPSGSADRPSGASSPVTPSGDISSRSVIESGDEPSPTGVGGAPESDSGATAAEDAPAAPEPVEAPAAAGSPQAPAAPADEAGEPAVATGSQNAAGAEPGEACDRAESESRDATTASGVPHAAAGDGGGIDGPTVAVPAAGFPAAAGPGVVTPPPPETAPPGAPAGAAAGGAPGDARAEQRPRQPQDARGPQQQDPRGAALSPPGPNGEPPEEPRDADAAALVAELEDEVVVIDEQPRYHVAGCRSLPGKPLIPLPVKEAVELGFTPCGWCAPDRTLSSRHPATTR